MEEVKTPNTTHVNGDDADDRVETIISVFQNCHVHIRRVDEPSYRKWHRQLPIEHCHAWNTHCKEYYEGPRLTREQAERRFGDDEGVPESVKYLRHKPDPAHSARDANEMVETETETDPETDREADKPETAPGDPVQEDHRDPVERATIAYTPTRSARRRIRFARRKNGSHWW